MKIDPRARREAIGARLRYDVLARCNFACYYCGTPAALGLKVLHVDHVIPVALGGTNDPWNLVAACWDCNAGKSSAMPALELVKLVRAGYADYANGRDYLEVKPCAWCSMPVTREFEDEEPLGEHPECGDCNEVWHRGYEYHDAEARKARG